MRYEIKEFELWLEGCEDDPDEISVTGPYINHSAEEDAAEKYLKWLLECDPDWGQYILMNSPVTVHVRDLSGNVMKVSVTAEMEMVYWPRTIKEKT